MLKLNSRFWNCYTIFSALILVLLLTSCGSDSKKANLLDPQVKYRSDTMYAHRRTEIVNEMDSLCILREDELLSQMIDSFSQRDIGDIHNILNRKSN